MAYLENVGWLCVAGVKARGVKNMRLIRKIGVHIVKDLR